MSLEAFLQPENRLLLALGLALVSVLIIIFIVMKKEGAEDVAPMEPQEQAPAMQTVEPVKTIEPIPQVVIPEEAKMEQVVPSDDKEFAEVSKSTEEPAEITPADLLPANSKANNFEVDFPKGEGEATDKNFLIAGYNIGINTVGSSLKNANLQLRSDPYIKRMDVGPWNQSTIMSSDLTNRRTLEIGS